VWGQTFFGRRSDSYMGHCTDKLLDNRQWHLSSTGLVDEWEKESGTAWDLE